MDTTTLWVNNVCKTKGICIFWIVFLKVFADGNGKRFSNTFWILVQTTPFSSHVNQWYQVKWKVKCREDGKIIDILPKFKKILFRMASDLSAHFIFHFTGVNYFAFFIYFFQLCLFVWKDGISAKVQQVELVKWKWRWSIGSIAFVLFLIFYFYFLSTVSRPVLARVC